MNYNQMKFYNVNLIFFYFLKQGQNLDRVTNLTQYQNQNFASILYGVCNMIVFFDSNINLNYLVCQNLCFVMEYFLIDYLQNLFRFLFVIFLNAHMSFMVQNFAYKMTVLCFPRYNLKMYNFIIFVKFFQVPFFFILQY